MDKFRGNSNKGFSLVELMVSIGVMGIVALTASTSYDTVSKMKSETDKSAVTADLRQKIGVLLRDPSFLTKQTAIKACMKLKSKAARQNCYRAKKTVVLNLNGKPLAGPWNNKDAKRSKSIKFKVDGSECTNLKASCKIVSSHTITEFCDWNGATSECNDPAIGAQYAQIDIVYELHDPQNKSNPFIELLQTSASITNQSINLSLIEGDCSGGYAFGVNANLETQCTASPMMLSDLGKSLSGFKLDGRKGDKGQRGIVGNRGPRGPRGPAGCSGGMVAAFDSALALEKHLDGPGDIISMNSNGDVKAVNKHGETVTVASGDLVDWASRGGGCFAEGTKIVMADGSKRKIENIKKGELVWNPLTNSPAVIYKGVKGPEKHPIYKFMVNGNQIEVTNTHPMITQRGVIKAEDVKHSDLFLTNSGELMRVESIETYITQKDVYNLHLVSEDGKDVEGGIVAEGIITGDLDMQQKLQKGIKEFSLNK